MFSGNDPKKLLEEGREKLAIIRANKQHFEKVLGDFDIFIRNAEATLLTIQDSITNNLILPAAIKDVQENIIKPFEEANRKIEEEKRKLSQQATVSTSIKKCVILDFEELLTKFKLENNGSTPTEKWQNLIKQAQGSLAIPNWKEAIQQIIAQGHQVVIVSRNKDPELIISFLQSENYGLGLKPNSQLQFHCDAKKSYQALVTEAIQQYKPSEVIHVSSNQQNIDNILRLQIPSIKKINPIKVENYISSNNQINLQAVDTFPDGGLITATSAVLQKVHAGIETHPVNQGIADANEVGLHYRLSQLAITLDSNLSSAINDVIYSRKALMECKPEFVSTYQSNLNDAIRKLKNLLPKDATSNKLIFDLRNENKDLYNEKVTIRDATPKKPTEQIDNKPEPTLKEQLKQMTGEQKNQPEKPIKEKDNVSVTSENEPEEELEPEKELKELEEESESEEEQPLKTKTTATTAATTTTTATTAAATKQQPPQQQQPKINPAPIVGAVMSSAQNLQKINIILNNQNFDYLRQFITTCVDDSNGDRIRAAINARKAVLLGNGAATDLVNLDNANGLIDSDAKLVYQHAVSVFNNLCKDKVIAAFAGINDLAKINAILAIDPAAAGGNTFRQTMFTQLGNDIGGVNLTGNTDNDNVLKAGDLAAIKTALIAQRNTLLISSALAEIHRAFPAPVDLTAAKAKFTAAKNLLAVPAPGMLSPETQHLKNAIEKVETKIAAYLPDPAVPGGAIRNTATTRAEMVNAFNELNAVIDLHHRADPSTVLVTPLLNNLVTHVHGLVPGATNRPEGIGKKLKELRSAITQLNSDTVRIANVARLAVEELDKVLLNFPAASVPPVLPVDPVTKLRDAIIAVRAEFNNLQYAATDPALSTAKTALNTKIGELTTALTNHFTNDLTINTPTVILTDVNIENLKTAIGKLNVKAQNMVITAAMDATLKAKLDSFKGWIADLLEDSPPPTTPGRKQIKVATLSKFTNLLDGPPPFPDGPLKENLKEIKQLFIDFNKATTGLDQTRIYRLIENELTALKNNIPNNYPDHAELSKEINTLIEGTKNLAINKATTDDDITELNKVRNNLNNIGALSEYYMDERKIIRHSAEGSQSRLNEIKTACEEKVDQLNRYDRYLTARQPLSDKERDDLAKVKKYKNNFLHVIEKIKSKPGIRAEKIAFFGTDANAVTNAADAATKIQNYFNPTAPAPVAAGNVSSKPADRDSFGTPKIKSTDKSDRIVKIEVQSDTPGTALKTAIHQYNATEKEFRTDCYFGGNFSNEKTTTGMIGFRTSIPNDEVFRWAIQVVENHRAKNPYAHSSIDISSGFPSKDCAEAIAIYCAYKGYSWNDKSGYKLEVTSSQKNLLDSQIGKHPDLITDKHASFRGQKEAVKAAEEETRPKYR